MHSSNSSPRGARQSDAVAIGKLKIAIQYWSKQSRVFELTNGALVFGVQLSPRRDASDSGEWHVETRLGTGLLHPPVASGWGDTPLEALRAAGKCTSEIRELAALDWEAVVAALHAVQAV
jgi:hypothetical protein